jgi:outer membrane protein OmpA-like peptidoglycan-associated protein
MKENPTYKLIIDGHTDSQGDDAKNMELSEKRAAAVKRYLVGKGVEEGRLTSRGFGETVPKASNDTSTGRAENRRVEFTVEF